MKDISEIRQEINELSKKINAPEEFTPTYETPRGDGHPCIKLDGSAYHLVYEERRKEFERKTTFSVDDLLYYVFDDVTYLMASDYELENRDLSEDPRKKMFGRQIELMRKISNDYAERLKKRIEGILRVSPYQKPPDFIK